VKFRDRFTFFCLYFFTCAQAAEVFTCLGTNIREKLNDDSPRCRKENRERKITEK